MQLLSYTSGLCNVEVVLKLFWRALFRRCSITTVFRLCRDSHIASLCSVYHCRRSQLSWTIIKSCSSNSTGHAVSKTDR